MSRQFPWKGVRFLATPAQKQQSAEFNPFADRVFLQQTVLRPLWEQEKLAVWSLSGPRAHKAFEKLTATKSLPKSAVSFLAADEKRESVCLWIPAGESKERRDQLKLLAPKEQLPSLVKSIMAMGDDFALSNEEFMNTLLFERRALMLRDVPEFQRILYTQQNEPTDNTQSQLRKLGVGVSVLYQSWKDQLLECQQWMHAQPVGTDPSLLRERLETMTKNQMKTIVSAMKNHINTDGRAPVAQQSLHVSIMGPPKVGKSTFLNTIGRKIQTTVSNASNQVVDSLVRINDLPLVFNDTVSITPTAVHPDTQKRMDSADLKICILDMKEIYDNKSATNVIPPEILDNIDSDTIILLNKCDQVSIRTPEPPAKIRFKNAPMGPQGNDVKRTAFRGRVPLRTDGNTDGNLVEFGDYGLRTLEDLRLTDVCLSDCRSTLHRILKNVKGGRFWLRVFPDHPMSKKPLGVRMGKGKGAFDHWEAKIPRNKILFEIGGSVREDIAREALRVLATRVPGKTEFVVAPKDETVEQVCARVADMPRVRPLGVWCVSMKTGEGIANFLEELCTLVKDRYASIPEDMSVYPESKRSQLIQKCISHVAEPTTTNMDQTIAQTVDTLDQLIQQDQVKEAIKYWYHFKYGILYRNQLSQRQ